MTNSCENIWFFLFNFLIIYCFSLGFVTPTFNITTTNFLRDSETLLSYNSTFKIGFFSPANSTYRYVGIWYNTESDGLEVVWVANRDNPLTDTSGFLKISAHNGNLELLDGKNKLFWSSNLSHPVNNSFAELLDTGNFVLRSSSSMTILWQSFEHPTDSWLPLVSFTVNEDTNTNPMLRSWKGPSDPSNGRFRFGIIPRNLPEFFTLDGDRPYWRSGPWNGYLYIGIPFMNSEVSTGFNIIDNHDGTLYVAYSVLNRSALERFELNYDGRVLQKFWNDGSRKWETRWQSIESRCGVYGSCGPFGTCDPNSAPICSCLQGFEPKIKDEWSRGNWTSGCIRSTVLQCGNGAGKEDKFLRLKHMKVPDFVQWLSSADENDCGKKCLAYCLCVAYSYYFGIGCMIWNGSLIDIQQFTGDGADLFIRLAHSELGETHKWKVAIAVIVSVGAATIGLLMYYLWRWISRWRKAADERKKQAAFTDSPLFKFGNLEIATNNFSENNKLGQGGFGSVYKGELQDGQQIAVKRLSRASGQGLQEFMNEVIVISKLQHRNLVRLLGSCIEGEEKLLVYEYMPNKSLNALLFDPHHQDHLDWKKRFSIIKGISRGLLYLHRDSRLRIIHRDIKLSNILLDEELNPKISDFGMARIFATKQDQANTLRVVGTYGYMSPEYAMEGRFSEKSDIYSFGVLLLEIVSGRRIYSYLDDESSSLLTHAWKLWNENDMLSLVDRTIFDLQFQEEMLLCIQLGLLCVQEFPEDRPSISKFISMLDNNEVTELPHPKQPGFTQRNNSSTDEIVKTSQDGCSLNPVSLTTISGR